MNKETKLYTFDKETPLQNRCMFQYRIEIVKYCDWCNNIIKNMVFRFLKAVIIQLQENDLNVLYDPTQHNLTQEVFYPFHTSFYSALINRHVIHAILF